MVLRWSSFRIVSDDPACQPKWPPQPNLINIGPYEKLVVWIYLLNWNQTLVKWSLGGPLSELYPMTQPANQDGRHSRTLFNIGPYGIFVKKSSCLELLAQFEPDLAEMVLRWSSYRIVSDDHPANQDGRHCRI